MATAVDVDDSVAVDVDGIVDVDSFDPSEQQAILDSTKNSSSNSQRKKDAGRRAKIIYKQLLKVVVMQIDDDNSGKKADGDDIARYLDPPNGDDIDDDDDDDVVAANAVVADADMLRFGAEVAEVLKLAKKETFYRDGLMLMHCLIGRLHDLGGEPVALVPFYHASAGYITIDTRGLYFILKDLAKTSDVECPETNMHGFVRNRLHHMPKALTISRSLFLQPDKTVAGRKTYFRSSFATDGVGTSLATRRWESFPNAPKKPEPVKKKATCLANAAAVARNWTTDHFNREFVGIDPGQTLKRLRYLYWSPYFRDMMELNINIKRRIHRWQTYNRKQSFIAQVCRCITEGLDKDKATICFGDGGFSNSSGGHRASISMQPFIDFLRREGWHVVTVSERNTSQVCSYCCRQFKYDYMPYKVCDVGDAADGHTYFYKPARNHFVRRCSVCHAILNRDGSAARNIGYLGMLEYYKRQRPLCFTKHLQEPPAYVVRRQLARSVQAAERAAAAFDTETPAAPVVPPVAGDTEAPLSNTKRRRLEHRMACSIGAELGRERKAQEVADIVASPNRYVEKPVNACPTLDPEAEWARVYDKITKGEKKQKEKKAASNKAKPKIKRTAKTTTPEQPASEEPVSKKSKTKKAKTTRNAPEEPAPKRNSRKRNAPEEPAPEEPASKKSKTKKKRLNYF
ncbi:hypothetical protein GGI17_000547 [Coemansia sp. S146]|nr:hypothetical protein GGI17_000547 [Coemansia sp. S146]